MRIPTLTRLNAAGISHIIVPLLVVMGIGIAGTFAMVSSKAADKVEPLESSAPSTAKAAKARNASYLVVFGTDKGYDQVKITPSAGVDTKTHTCGGSFKNGSVVKSITTTKPKKISTAAGVQYQATPKKIKCSAIGGGASYTVQYGSKKNGFKGEKIVVDTDAGYCQILRPEKAGSIKRLLNGSQCPTENADGLITPMGVSVEASPGDPVKQKAGKIVGGTFIIKENNPTFEATRILCTGSATVTLLGNGGAEKPLVTKVVPITFRGNSDKDKGHDRCVISLKGLRSAYTFKEADSVTRLVTVKVNVDASPYYAPAIGSVPIQFN